MSIKGAAAHLGISSGRLYGLVNAGEVDHVRVGRRTYISRVSLTKLIDENTRTGYQAENAR
jgi:excisionase family DNA binding protein